MDRAFEKEPRLRKDSVLFLKEASRMMEERNESIDNAFVTLRRLCTTCHAFARILSNQDTFLTHLQIFYDECNRDETRSLILALVRVAISSNPHARESFDVDSTLYKTYRNVYGGSSKTSSASWTCPACTYKNTKNSSKCEMCETSRPTKAIETKKMTAPSSSWTGKQPLNRSRDDDFDDDDEEKEEEKQNAELTRRILSVYNAYDDDGEDDDAIFGSEFSIGMVGMQNKNHGDQAKTQSERILRDAEDRERAALMAEAPVKIAALHEELERLGPNDREAIKSIRKQIERWKTLCIPKSTSTEEESKPTTKTKSSKTKTKNSTSNNRDKNGLPIRYTRADGKKKGSSSRRRKNRNKASVGNHNRKNRAARKRK